MPVYETDYCDEWLDKSHWTSENGMESCKSSIVVHYVLWKKINNKEYSVLAVCSHFISNHISHGIHWLESCVAEVLGIVRNSNLCSSHEMTLEQTRFFYGKKCSVLNFRNGDWRNQIRWQMVKACIT